MAGIPQVTKTGPRTYTPDELVLGGQLVEALDNGRIGVAEAGSTRVLGVALVDAQSPDDVATGPTVVNGRQVLNAAIVPVVTTVAYGGIETPVTYSAAADFGDVLVSTGNGKVGPAGETPDPRSFVGRCTAPDGVAANAVGLMRTL